MKTDDTAAQKAAEQIGDKLEFVYNMRICKAERRDFAKIIESCLAEQYEPTTEDWAVHPTQRALFIRGFVEAIVHGTEEHRAWLRAAGEAHIAGRPIPRCPCLAEQPKHWLEQEREEREQELYGGRQQPPSAGEWTAETVRRIWEDIHKDVLALRLSDFYQAIADAHNAVVRENDELGKEYVRQTDHSIDTLVERIEELEQQLAEARELRQIAGGKFQQQQRKEQTNEK